VTTSEATGLATLYFRKPVWLALTRATVAALESRLALARVASPEARAALRRGWAGAVDGYPFVAAVALRPKTSGLRPIMNLSRCLPAARIEAAVAAAQPRAGAKRRRAPAADASRDPAAPPPPPPPPLRRAVSAAAEAAAAASHPHAGSAPARRRRRRAPARRRPPWPLPPAARSTPS